MKVVLHAGYLARERAAMEELYIRSTLLRQTKDGTILLPAQKTAMAAPRQSQTTRCGSTRRCSAVASKKFLDSAAKRHHCAGRRRRFVRLTLGAGPWREKTRTGLVWNRARGLKGSPNIPSLSFGLAVSSCSLHEVASSIPRVLSCVSCRWYVSLQASRGNAPNRA